MTTHPQIIVTDDIGVASATKDWWDLGWQLTRGCSRVSEGCRNCTAEIMTARNARFRDYAERVDGDPHNARWTGKVTIHPDRLIDPRHWEPGSWVFVCPVSDLFHDDVPEGFVLDALEVMREAPQFTFGLLTKRADRMARILGKVKVPNNVMCGVSVENQDQVQRLDALRAVDAQVRWASVEPMLGPVDLRQHLGEVVSWVTFGPEIGLHHRAFDSAWATDLIDQCRCTAVPVFCKYSIDGEPLRGRP